MGRKLAPAWMRLRRSGFLDKAQKEAASARNAKVCVFMLSVGEIPSSTLFDIGKILRPQTSPIGENSVLGSSFSISAGSMPINL